GQKEAVTMRPHRQHSTLVEVALRGSHRWFYRAWGTELQKLRPTSPSPRKASVCNLLGRSPGLGFNLGLAFPLAQWLIFVLVTLHSCGAAPDFHRLPVHRVLDR